MPLIHHSHRVLLVNIPILRYFDQVNIDLPGIGVSDPSAPSVPGWTAWWRPCSSGSTQSNFWTWSLCRCTRPGERIWWCHEDIFHLFEMIIPADESFLEGLKPPTRDCLWFFSWRFTWDWLGFNEDSMGDTLYNQLNISLMWFGHISAYPKSTSKGR